LVSEISKYGSINVNLAWHRDFRFPVPCQICGAQKNKTVIWVTAILNSRSCRWNALLLWNLWRLVLQMVRKSQKKLST